MDIQRIWQALDEIKDPEIPVVSLVEMGIVRDVRLDGQRVTVDFAPTFSGCPALDVMRRDIRTKLRDELGFAEVEVRVVLNPPWTSNWMSDGAREKLLKFGLAPPHSHASDAGIVLFDAVNCPRCGSPNVTLKNAFGSTLCRAMYQCDDCKEPFEQFKAL